MLSKQLSPSPANSDTSSNPDEVSELPSLRKVRGHTVSVVNTLDMHHHGTLHDKGKADSSTKESTKHGLNPSCIFLQLYHSGILQAGNEMPILLPHNETTERSIKMLDHIYPYETHKIGVIYVGPRQTKNEKDILSNQFGSERYARFVQSLGQLIRLKDCDPNQQYIGGLDTKGSDGLYTYGWRDESVQLIFHIATLMPNRDSDPNCNAKKLHIGNDFVTIVYNDSREEYKIGIIKGQFNYVNIVIKPLDYESNTVTLQAKEDIAEILGHKDTKIISDTNLAALVQQIAMHCNLASMVLQREHSNPQDPFASNWLERLRKIRQIKAKAFVDGGSHISSHDIPSSRTPMEDFTDYV